MRFSPVVPWIAWRSDKSVVSAVEHMAVWNSEEDWRDGLAQCPSIYTNGQEVGKTFQRKSTRPISKIFWFRFLPSETRTKHPAHAKRNLGGSDPVRPFGRQNRTNTGVAPAQIEVFVRGLFAGLISVLLCSTGRCGGVWVNGTRMFTGEHCLYSCVHPCRRIAEREEYLSTGTLHVFLRSGPLNPLLSWHWLP
jgi:hypothetical protein